MKNLMIVTDLDGTLLHSDKTVSDYTKDVFLRCRERGIKTAVATARGHPVKVVPLELFEGQILCNGAALVTDGVTRRRAIPYREARPLLLACAGRGLTVSAQFGDMHYYSAPETASVWPDITLWTEVDYAEHEVDTEKVNIAGVTPEDAAFITEILPETLYLRVARDGLGMVMRKDATKAQGAADLAQLWGVPREGIIAFGDDLNDIDMLTQAGTGVAVRNALDEVKRAADCICMSNDEDGVARWIAEMYLSPLTR
ncbi:MAG: HAD family hydrolase [Oscillospiraceae bacterium]|jgi:Cof subfamily protein (haloacid dehalogenase superfamily)|nr:HAD family hydrolase [Oscillospiraceae bacterium]